MLCPGANRKATVTPAMAWRIPEPALMAQVVLGGCSLDPKSAAASVSLAPLTRGAAIGADGTLWLTQSDGTFGRLQRADAATGKVEASFAIPAGIEDIEFAPDGHLWAVSEAGTQRWKSWSTFFPLVFALDTKALR
jgi:streptogramin lyase